MSLLCAVFGHKQNPRPSDGSGYITNITGGQVDGIGREHVQLYLRCPRCGDDYLAAMLHVDPESQVPFLRKKRVRAAAQPNGADHG